MAKDASVAGVTSVDRSEMDGGGVVSGASVVLSSSGTMLLGFGPASEGKALVPGSSLVGGLVTDRLSKGKSVSLGGLAFRAPASVGSGVVGGSIIGVGSTAFRGVRGGSTTGVGSTTAGRWSAAGVESTTVVGVGEGSTTGLLSGSTGGDWGCSTGGKEVSAGGGSFG